MFQTRHVLKYTLDKILRCFDKINGWSWMTQWVVTKTHFGIRGAACLPLHRDEGWLCETRVPPTMCRLFDVNLLFCEITQYPFFCEISAVAAALPSFESDIYNVLYVPRRKGQGHSQSLREPLLHMNILSIMKPSFYHSTNDSKWIWWDLRFQSVK